MSRRKYKIGDEVKLKTDTENLPRMITKYEVSKQGTSYCLSAGTNISWHFEFEIEPAVEKKQIGLRKSGSV